MKFNLILSVLFAFVTYFSSIHEIEHMLTDDASSCLVCSVSHNLVSADVVDKPKEIEILHFEKIPQENSTSTFHAKSFANQNRAPPLTV